MEKNMSLLSEAMESCVMMDKTTVPDGYGGFSVAYVQGARFLAAVVLDDSIQARTSMAEGLKSVYTITTEKNINLQFHDVIMRKRDNKIFRVTSDGDDKHTPQTAGLNMRQVSAEEWVIPNG